ncbi:MAG: hypothetical protein FJ028_01980 [Chloroflexi bacterium]|nr:hypothetical protein [Chloroflexota bacterium]
MTTPYVLEPHWANWMLAVEMFVAGLAAGIFFFIALANTTGRKEDREVGAILGFFPAPLMLIAAILLTVDLGQPGRFLNLIFTSPAATERPGPFMLNPNSPMNWGTYVILVFGALTVIPFLDALRHTGRLPFARGLVETLAHDPVGMFVCAALALATGSYSGVLLNVTNLPVWSDTYLQGALYVTFSALGGFAAAGIVADRLRAHETAGAVRTGLMGISLIAAVLLALYIGNLVALGTAGPLVTTMVYLVAPSFWIGAVGLAVLLPLVVVTTGARLRLARVDVSSLAVLGMLVLIGVFAFRWSIMHSALAALGH